MLAMEFTQPQQYRARLAEKYYLNEGERYMFLHFELAQPKRLAIRAGQHLHIKANEQGERRPFSLVHTPDVDHAVSVVAEILPSGIASQMFVAMQPGDEIELLAPLGRFVVNEQKPGENLLFVATGSGIAPLYSMIQDLLRNQH